MLIKQELWNDIYQSDIELHKRMNKRLKRVMTAIVLLFSASANAQELAVKTNLVSDVLLSPNIGVEAGLHPRWTMNVTGELNAWPLNGHKWKHWFVRPELRYWFCRRFAGHFAGVHLIGGQYNFANIDMNFKFAGSDFRNLADRRYQGWGAGAGIAYGYDWIISKHWNIEATVGVGWIYTRFDSYPCAKCGSKIDSNKPHNYVGPTTAALNIVYLF